VLGVDHVLPQLRQDCRAGGARARDRSAVEGAEPGDTLKVRERVLAGVTQAYRGGLFLTSVCQIA